MQCVPGLRNVWFPYRISITTPEGEWRNGGAGDEWEGRLKALRREMEEMERKVASKYDVEKMQSDIKAILEAVKKVRNCYSLEYLQMAVRGHNQRNTPSYCENSR